MIFLSFSLLFSLFQLTHSLSADFVIVGGGTAGCVLASRLCAALPKANIILLERGTPRNSYTDFLVQAPRNALDAWNETQVSESFDTLPNPGLYGRTTRFITGNTLGGSSSINGMQWTVPVGQTVSNWRIRGLNSINSQIYYNRAFQQLNPNIPKPAMQQTYTNMYLRAAEKTNIKYLDHPFDMKIKTGIWQNYLLAKNGRRVDSCTAYLYPVMHTSCAQNLKLVQGVTVTKILTKKKRSKIMATGVEYVKSTDKRMKNKMRISATREVILSAGPVGSPKLLQLSGIGPQDVLRRYRIPKVIVTSIGEQTQARPLTLVPILYTNMSVPPENDPRVLSNSYERVKYEKGIASVFNIAIGSVNGILRRLGYFYSTYVGLPDQGLGLPFFNYGCFTNPVSFGSLKIRSRNPFDSPNIQLNLMGNIFELRRTLSCLRRLSGVTKNLETPVIPLIKSIDEAYVRATSGFGFHFVGGCAAGQALAPDLTVRGIKGLRVVDASVIREIPMSAGPLASTYMIAEFVSEKLIKCYRCIYENNSRCLRW